MRIITLFAFFIITSVCAFGQNLIGYNDKEIKEYMKENCRGMNFNNVTNSKFKYLKYSDNSDNQTFLFFLNPDSVCNSVRMICNVNMKAEKVKELDSTYTKISENRWIDKRKGKDYFIEMKDEKWSCIVIIEPDK